MQAPSSPTAPSRPSDAPSVAPGKLSNELIEDALTDSGRQRLMSGTRFKLRLAFLVVVIVALLTLLLRLAVDQVFTTLTPSIERDLQWKTTSGVHELRFSADLAVLVKDKTLIAAAASRYVHDPDVEYLGFFDEQAEPLFEHGTARALALRAQGRPAAELLDTDSGYAAWEPIEVEGLRVGKVALVVSKQRLKAGEKLRQRISQVSLLGAFGALLAGLLFFNLYISPILKLSEQAFARLKETTSLALESARAKSRFLANMSHEIRTPMNGVLGMIRLVLRTDVTAKQRAQLETIARSAKSLLAIVNDILDLSRLEANQYVLRPEACDLRAVVEESVELLRPAAHEKQLSLEVEVAADVPAALVLDANRVRQILTNLVGNAVKFTQKGGVRVQIGLVQGGSQVLFEIEDTGPGVPEHAQATIFEAFTQAEEGYSRSHEGTGLGLAICRKLVRLMHGELGYRAREPASHGSPGGSVFWFALPVERADVAPKSQAPRPDSVRPLASAKPILLVDDNEINRVVASETLEELGLSAHSVSSGEAALEALQKDEYALVLMDCQMPGLDGYEATRRIRKSEVKGRRLPILAFTAHALSGELDKAIEAGMDDVVTKPLDLTSLRRTLRRYLDTSPPPAEPAAAAESAPKPAAPPPEPEARPVLSERARSATLVNLFLTQVPQQIEALKGALEKAERGALGAAAHKLKGSAGSFGALRMADVCAALQRGCHDAPVSVLGGLVAEVESEFRLVEARLRELREKVSAA